jgi:hypothetical protein
MHAVALPDAAACVFRYSLTDEKMNLLTLKT